jgi:hypothetical protein
VNTENASASTERLQPNSASSATRTTLYEYEMPYASARVRPMTPRVM